MQRLRTTFTRSRTPTGAEMKMQNSLEVPKQVRSASFDEMQLEAQRASAHLLKQQSSSSAEERSSERGFLQVPQVAHAQRSHSFDSAVASVGSDDSVSFLDVPRRLKARRSSSTKTPPPCIHCFYVEQYEKEMTADRRYFIDHCELSALSYSNSSSEESDDDDDETDDGDQAAGGADADEEVEGACGYTYTSGGTEMDDDAAIEMDIRMSHLSMAICMGVSIEESRAQLPRQMRRHTIGSSVTTSEDEGLESSGNGSPHYGNTLMPPQQTTPCGITFTLSPTNGDFPPLPNYGFPIDPNSPPGSPLPLVRANPLLELPSTSSGHQLLGSTVTAAAATLTLPMITASGGNTINAPACSSADADDAGAAMGVPMGRGRRRSISRQEAIFVEPTGNSLENVSHEEVDNTKSSVDEAATRASCVSPTLAHATNVANAATAAMAAAAANHAAFVVRDIYLTVPDLRRDRAASVDSCFSKVSSGNKTEELQPSEDGCFLIVPNINATRSRSVDIVLPTDEQARYKALAMTGGGSGVGVGGGSGASGSGSSGTGAAADLYADGYVQP